MSSEPLQSVAQQTAARAEGGASILKIKCGDKTFTIEPAIASQKSEFFKIMLQSAFKEANTHIVELHDDQPEDIARMIEFFYTDDYDRDTQDILEQRSIIPVGCFAAEKLALKNKGVSEALGHVAMYALAEKYITPELKILAIDNFIRIRDVSWIPENALDVVRAVYDTAGPGDRGIKTALFRIFGIFININTEDTSSRVKAFSVVEEVLTALPEAYIDFLKLQLNKAEKTVESVRAQSVRDLGQMKGEIEDLKSGIEVLSGRCHNLYVRCFGLLNERTYAPEERDVFHSGDS